MQRSLRTFLACNGAWLTRKIDFPKYSKVTQRKETFSLFIAFSFTSYQSLVPQIFNFTHTFLCPQFFIFSLLCFSLVFLYFLFFRFFLFQYFTRENEYNSFNLFSRDSLLVPFTLFPLSGALPLQT